MRPERINGCYEVGGAGTKRRLSVKADQSDRGGGDERSFLLQGSRRMGGIFCLELLAGSPNSLVHTITTVNGVRVEGQVRSYGSVPCFRGEHIISERVQSI